MYACDFPCWLGPAKQAYNEFQHGLTAETESRFPVGPLVGGFCVFRKFGGSFRCTADTPKKIAALGGNGRQIVRRKAKILWDLV